MSNAQVDMQTIDLTYCAAHKDSTWSGEPGTCANHSPFDSNENSREICSAETSCPDHGASQIADNWYTDSGTAPRVIFPVVYADMDGTTLDDNREIRPATLEVFKKYMACGGRLGIATGRPWQDVRSFVEQIQPNMPVVVLNGGQIFDPDGTMIEQTFISKENVMATLKAAESFQGIQATILIYPDGSYFDRDGAEIRNFVQRTKSNLKKVCSSLEDCLNDPGQTLRPMKVGFLVDPARADALAQQLQKGVGSRSKVMIESHSDAFVSVIPLDIDKSTAIEGLLAQKGFSMGDLVFFGESQNDVGALAAASLGVAMGNCYIDACAAASLVADTNETDAIAHVMEQFVLTPTCW